MKNNIQVRIHTGRSKPYMGKRVPASEYKGCLPNSEPWPWQKKEKKEEKP